MIYLMFLLVNWRPLKNFNELFFKNFSRNILFFNIELLSFLLLSGYSAVWLAHLLWEQRVAGSSPATPTTIFHDFSHLQNPLKFFLTLRSRSVAEHC